MPSKKTDVTKNSSVLVSRTIGRHGSGQEPVTSEEEEILAVHRFITNPAEVEVSVGLTINTGNYNTAKLHVSVRLPCYKEEIDEAYVFAQKWVEDRVQHEKALIDNYRDSKQKNPF